MNIELSSADLELMREVVAQSVRDLRTEIAHTDTREYRAALESKLEHLETLEATLESSSETTLRSAPAHVPPR